MRALRIVNTPDGLVLTNLPLPSLHREGGWIDPAPYRLQASCALPIPVQNLSQSAGLRTIHLADGAHLGLFDNDTPTLTFIISGELNLSVGDNAVLRPGDVLLTSSTAIAAQAVGSCRLMQLAVTPDWPGPDATEQDSGTIVQRTRSTPHLRRMDRGADGRSCSAPFDNLFPTELDRWSQTTPVTGFRFLCFPDGAFIDWHPEVVNNLAIFLSGDMEIEIGGTGSRIDHFLAGDVLLAADRTGEGHIDRMHGVIHLALIVLEDEHLWPTQDGE
jgi:hypothetical protein